MGKGEKTTGRVKEVKKHELRIRERIEGGHLTGIIERRFSRWDAGFVAV